MKNRINKIMRIQWAVVALTLLVSGPAFADYSSKLDDAISDFGTYNTDHGAEFPFLGSVLSDLMTAKDYSEKKTNNDPPSTFAQHSIQQGTSYYRTRRAVSTIHANVDDFSDMYPIEGAGVDAWVGELGTAMLDDVEASVASLSALITGTDPAWWSETVTRANDRIALGRAENWGNKKANQALAAYWDAAGLYELTWPSGSRVSPAQQAAKASLDAGELDSSLVLDLITNLYAAIRFSLFAEISQAQQVSTAGRTQLQSVVTKLEAVDQCLTGLMTLTLTDQGFALCYLDVVEIVELLDQVQGSLVDTYVWRAMMATAVYALLDQSLYYGEESITAQLETNPDHPNKDEAEIGIAEQEQGTTELREGAVDAAVTRYINNRCRIVYVYNRFFGVNGGQIDEAPYCPDLTCDDSDDPACWDAVCGNGVLEGVLETCDDGGVIAGDGCSETCRKEEGFDCVHDAGSSTDCFRPCELNNGDCGDVALVTCVENTGAAPTCLDTDECLVNNGDCGDPVYWSCTNNHAAVQTCADINECLDDNGGCGDPGAWTCVNNPGAIPSCEDFNECLVDNGGCGDATFFACANLEGSKTCTDIDECLTDHGGCGDATYYTCTNNVGAVPFCADIDECATNNGECGGTDAWTCVNNDGAVPTCNDKNECARGTVVCNAISSCVNTQGSAYCECDSGYAGGGVNDADGSTCADVDECNGEGDGNNCHANASCTNNVGSFSCACNSGYTGDGVTCSDVDECADGTDNCHANGSCTNNAGSFSCACNNGYSGDGVACANVDECAADTDNCHANATCTDNDGSFSCACNSGYSGTGTACADVNECTAGTDNCHANASCTNTPGTFTCACNSGYSGSGTSCTDIDECATNNGDCGDAAAWTCGNNAGAAPTCTDINECTAGTDNCHGNASCTNSVGSFSCACNGGYTGSGTSCTDDNECAGQGSGNNCDGNASCANTAGSFTCACNGGYSGPGTSCTDINECTVGTDNCDANASCTNSAGSFSCACNSGYSGTGTSCTDDNECTANTDNCHANAACANTAGSFTCTCNSGYSGNGTSCSDLNECSGQGGGHNCHANASCTNNAGGFSCACNAGYSGNGTSCTDYNECNGENGGHNCNANAACTNTGGSFTCACNGGYTGNGVTCTDVNECNAGLHNCHGNATCTNNAGGFSCACNGGYTGTGQTCSDINECTSNTNPHNCNANAACTNTTGSFTCACNGGYTGNGVSCSDVNECSTGQHNCHGWATCFNSTGSFSCTCNAGFTGSGTSCSDINECTDNTHSCDDRAVCSNTNGGYGCSCDPGFEGTGWNCSDTDECANDGTLCNRSGQYCLNSVGAYSCQCLTNHADCDNNMDNGCDSLRSLQHCNACNAVCQMAHASETCNTGTCEVKECDNLYCDGNGGDDGCETPLSTNPDCGSTYTNLGSIDGDQGSTEITKYDLGDKWFKVRVNEGSWSSKKIGVLITLIPPVGGDNTMQDYDLFVSLNGCNTGASGWATGAGNEYIYAYSNDSWGSNNSFDAYIKVVTHRANICDQWTLKVRGNY